MVISSSQGSEITQYQEVLQWIGLKKILAQFLCQIQAFFGQFFRMMNIALFRGDLKNEKIPKISASGRNFLDPLPSSKKGPTDENDGISYLIVIIKFVFFKISNPPSTISSESWFSPILSIEVVPNSIA